jgi:glycerol-3-phosphate dehydrogenase
MIDDTSLEFDMFEDARQRLVAVLMVAGRDRLEAEKIALYVIQGLRDMPRLITMLSETRSHTPTKILQALNVVLDNANALEKARALLLEEKEERGTRNDE